MMVFFRRFTIVNQKYNIMKGKELKIVFGLEKQGHIPVIQEILAKWNAPCDVVGKVDMTYSKCVWEEIGDKIGWCPFTAALSYFRYLNKKN